MVPVLRAGVPVTDFAAAPPKMTPCLMNGTWTLLLPHERALWDSWRTGWETERLQHMHANIRPGDVVYDIGAEHGDISGLCASWAGPEGGVVLVEPSPGYWPSIRAIFEANGLGDPLFCWAGFASDVTVEAPAQMDSGVLLTGGWPRCSRGPIQGDAGFRTVWERGHDTPQARIDDLVVWSKPPDVITMDIEGAELLALRGAQKTLETFRPLVYVSVHPDDFMAPYGYNQADLWEFVAGLGYEPYLIAEDHELHALLFHPEGRKVVWP